MTKSASPKSESTGTIKITLKRSVIGRPQNQVDTVKALGLRKIGDSRELPTSPALRGMVRTVEHLLEVEA